MPCGKIKSESLDFQPQVEAGYQLQKKQTLEGIKFLQKSTNYLIAGGFFVVGLFSFVMAGSMWSLLLAFLGMLSILVLLNIPSKWIEESFGTISYRLKISSLIAGGLFLAIASSSPEFFTAMSGVVWYKVFSIGFDTLVWSSLFNMCVILGACTFYKSTLVVDRSILRRDMPFFAMTIFMMLFLALDGAYTFWDFIILILIYVVYVVVLYLDKSEPYKEETQDSWRKVYLKLFAGLAVIALLAHTMVSLGQHSVGIIENLYGYVMPIGVLACTIYGPGTSIADMFMSIAATKKGEDSAAVVNSIGSNTFDLTICLGVPGLIYTLMTGEAIAIDLSNSILLIGMMIVGFLLLLGVLWDKKITKQEGLMLLGYYGGCTIVFLVQIL